MAVYSATFYMLASRMAFGAAPAGPSPRGPDASLPAAWPGLTVGALWIVSYALLFDIPVSHDVVWQMWIARQLSHGATLYGDILEINPPLWFWLALPVERMAGILGVPPVQAMVAAVFAQIGLAIALLARLIDDETDGRRAMILSAALVAFVVVPLPDFAQREHLALVGAIPYLALVSRRRRGMAVAWPLAAAVGAFAAPAFALKHYFVLVPALLEIWLITGTRRAWMPLRPETAVLGLAACLYAAAILALAPEFFEVIVPMVRYAYGGYETALAVQIAKLWVFLWIIAGFAIWYARRSLDSLALAGLIAAAAFCVSYFLQQKGWRYHALPVSATLFFVLSVLLIRLPRGRDGLPRRLAVAAAAILIAFLSLLIGPYENRRAASVETLLADVVPGDTVLMLTANPSSIWPMVEDLGLTWPSRHFAFWMMNAFHAAQAGGSPLSGGLADLADEIRAQTVHDISCNPPRIILVDSFERSLAPGFDIVSFFETSAGFREIFSHYALSGASGLFTSYRLSGDWTPPRPRDCRTVY